MSDYPHQWIGIKGRDIVRCAVCNAFQHTVDEDCTEVMKERIAELEEKLESAEKYIPEGRNWAHYLEENP